MTIQFPNVPNFPGVPLLNRTSLPSIVSNAQTAVGAVQTLANELGFPLSTIFGNSPLFGGTTQKPLPAYSISVSGGTAVFIPDSVVELEFSADSSIMSHPVELGGFAAYNRVQDPQSIRLLLACQGKHMDRPEFLKALETMREGTTLYVIATPDTTYDNMALKSYSYKKTAENGAVTIWADTQWRESRSTNVVVSAPTSAQPQGASVTNLGAITPQGPAPSLASIINSPPVTPSPLPADVASEAPPSGIAF